MDRSQPHKKISLFCIDCGKAIFPKQMYVNPEGNRCRVCNNKFRNSNPEFKEARSNQMKEMNKVLPQNPKWRTAHAEGIKKRDADPTMAQKRQVGYKKRSQNPEWMKKMKERAVTRSQDPNWRAKKNEQNKSLASDPVWKEAVINGCAIRDKDPEYRKRVSAGLQGIPIEEWEGFTHYYPYCPKFNSRFKEGVRILQGHRCALCGNVWKPGVPKHSVHHVHNRKDSCCAKDAPTIFVLLCSKGCHQRTSKNWRKYVERFTRYVLKNFNGKSYYTKEEMESILS